MTRADDQSQTIAWLSSPAAYGGQPIQRVDTHISVVFLTGGDAFKLKRAVRFDFLDFSTADLRRRRCEDEVRLNRRTAPSIYKGVLPITRQADGSLAIDGAGTPVDWVVHMQRFDQAQLLDRLAQAGALPIPLMDPLARSIAVFHRDAARRHDRGGARGLQLVVDGNDRGLHALDGDVNANAVTRLMDLTRAEFERVLPVLEERRRQGAVRECHGDLHLGNIVLIDGRPTLFDAIEFNDDIACCDVLYDLAFLIMDLRHRGLGGHANTLLNAYLEETGDYGGLRLLPLFLSCRAAVRAKIDAASARVQQDRNLRLDLQVQAREYLQEGIRYLHHTPPIALAIGGPSGAGKSTTAAALAPAVLGAPGAVVLRSDVIRKRLCGVDRLDRLGSSGYTSDVSAQVYGELASRMTQVLNAGQAVIVDATFLHASDRNAIAAASRAAGVELQGFWLDAPDAVLLDRLRRRRHDPSDANSDVLAAQRRLEVGEMSWSVINAENSGVVGKILGLIRCNAAFSAGQLGV